jgi:hypothetical protein
VFLSKILLLQCFVCQKMRIRIMLKTCSKILRRTNLLELTVTDWNLDFSVWPRNKMTISQWKRFSSLRKKIETKKNKNQMSKPCWSAFFVIEGILPYTFFPSKQIVNQALCFQVLECLWQSIQTLKRTNALAKPVYFVQQRVSHTLLVMQSFAPTPSVSGHLPALASCDIFIWK